MDAEPHRNSCSSSALCTTMTASLQATGEGRRFVLARHNRQLCCSEEVSDCRRCRGPCCSHAEQSLPDRSRHSLPRTCVTAAYLELGAGRHLGPRLQMAVMHSNCTKTTVSQMPKYRSRRNKYHLNVVSPVAIHLSLPHGSAMHGFDSHVGPNHPSSHSQAATAGASSPPRYVVEHRPRIPHRAMSQRLAEQSRPKNPGRHVHRRRPQSQNPVAHIRASCC